MLLLFVCVSPLISLWVNGSQWKIASPPLTGVFLGCTKMNFEAEPALHDPFSLGTTYVLLCRQFSMSFSLLCETVMNISQLLQHAYIFPVVRNEVMKEISRSKAYGGLERQSSDGAFIHSHITYQMAILLILQALLITSSNPSCDQPLSLSC